MGKNYLPRPLPPQVRSAIAMEVPEGSLLVANACRGHSHIGLQEVMKVPGDVPLDVPHTWDLWVYLHLECSPMYD